jgi:hypothetical protein
MIGPTAVGGFVAGFLILLLIGWWRDELGRAGIAVFFCLWLGGFVGLRYIPSIGSLFTSYVAVLDIALVFIVCKGDIRVT